MANLQESLKKLQKLQTRPDGVTSDEWRTIRKGLGELQKRKEWNPKQHKAQTQSHLAKLFIRWYFSIIITVLLYVPLYNAGVRFIFPDAEFINVKDVFMMVSAAITPILAFVLGHYFKGRD